MSDKSLPRGWGSVELDTQPGDDEIQLRATFTPGEDFFAALQSLGEMARRGHLVVLKLGDDE